MLLAASLRQNDRVFPTTDVIVEAPKFFLPPPVVSLPRVLDSLVLHFLLAPFPRTKCRRTSVIREKNIREKKKRQGPIGARTLDLSIRSRTPYHWAMGPSYVARGQQCHTESLR